jgi:preprotein translocase subunit YajC
MEINFESVSFVVAIVSIILAVISLIFSILFYRWSEKSNKQTFELSKGIENNTKKIEGLFDRFYSDTFGLMKSNYEAMQSSIFNTPISSGDSSQTAEEQIESIIIALISKSKFLTRETVCHFFDQVHPQKKLTHKEINLKIDNLSKNNSIYINGNMISISSEQESENDGGES